MGKVCRLVEVGVIEQFNSSWMVVYDTLELVIVVDIRPLFTLPCGLRTRPIVVLLTFNAELRHDVTIFVK